MSVFHHLLSTLPQRDRQSNSDPASLAETPHHELAPFYTALKTYNKRLAEECLALEAAPKSEIDLIQTREELQRIQTGTISFQRSIRSMRHHNEYPFADPFYWAGFICQGLA